MESHAAESCTTDKERKYQVAKQKQHKQREERAEEDSKMEKGEQQRQWWLREEFYKLPLTLGEGWPYEFCDFLFLLVECIAAPYICIIGGHNVAVLPSDKYGTTACMEML